jgi:hypothetical protein
MHANKRRRQVLKDEDNDVEKEINNTTDATAVVDQSSSSKSFRRLRKAEEETKSCTVEEFLIASSEAQQQEAQTNANFSENDSEELEDFIEEEESDDADENENNSSSSNSDSSASDEEEQVATIHVPVTNDLSSYHVFNNQVAIRAEKQLLQTARSVKNSIKPEHRLFSEWCEYLRSGKPLDPKVPPPAFVQKFDLDWIQFRLKTIVQSPSWQCDALLLADINELPDLDWSTVKGNYIRCQACSRDGHPSSYVLSFSGSAYIRNQLQYPLIKEKLLLDPIHTRYALYSVCTSSQQIIWLYHSITHFKLKLMLALQAQHDSTQISNWLKKWSKLETLAMDCDQQSQQRFECSKPKFMTQAKTRIQLLFPS